MGTVDNEPRGWERAEDAADLLAKEDLSQRITFGMCTCGHLQIEHPSPHLCWRCSCGEYVEVGRA